MTMLSNTISREELSTLLGIPAKFIKEDANKTMKGFGLNIVFSSLLKENPRLPKLENLSRELSYAYEIRFNAANYTAHDLKNFLKNNCQEIYQHLNKTLVQPGITYDFTIFLMGDHNQYCSLDLAQFE